MNQTIFARGKPSKVEIIETYQYHADIAGNQVIEEKGQPEGEIRVEVPFDGWKYFSRPALADVHHQHTETSGDLYARIGQLGVCGISPESFWLNEENPASRLVVPLDVPIPNSSERLDTLIDDQRRAVLRHNYRPKWPVVDPRPIPLSLKIDIFDEKTLQDKYGEISDPNIWRDRDIAQELSFERVLSFRFKMELAFSKGDKRNKPQLIHSPILRLARIEWPVATSYQMLELSMEDKNSSSVNSPDLFYRAEEGSVEWSNVEFKPGSFSADKHAQEMLHLYRAPEMILKVKEPGEFYQNRSLMCRLEIELPGTLLSEMDVQCFSATGYPANDIVLSKRTCINVDVEIALESRFDRKILSPLQQLHFENVILNERRMSDIALLLRDLGFNIIKHKREDGTESPYFDGTERLNYPDYFLIATKQEGPDSMLLLVHAFGGLAETQRERSLKGGEKYTTTQLTGSTRVDMRAELSGNVHRLTQVLNTIHLKLKDIFSHAVDMG